MGLWRWLTGSGSAREADPETASPTAALEPGERPAPTARQEWSSAPRMPRAVVQPVLLSDSGRFEASLITRQNPEFLRPLAHAVSAEAPTGLLRGLIQPAGAPQVRSTGSDLPVATRPTPVQRMPVPAGTGPRLTQAVTPAAPRVMPVVAAPPLPAQVAAPAPIGTGESSAEGSLGPDVTAAQDTPQLEAPDPPAPAVVEPPVDVPAAPGPQPVPVQRAPSPPGAGSQPPEVAAEVGTDHPLLGATAFGPTLDTGSPGDDATLPTAAGGPPAVPTGEPGGAALPVRPVASTSAPPAESAAPPIEQGAAPGAEARPVVARTPDRTPADHEPHRGDPARSPEAPDVPTLGRSAWPAGEPTAAAHRTAPHQAESGQPVRPGLGAPLHQLPSTAGAPVQRSVGVERMLEALSGRGADPASAATGRPSEPGDAPRSAATAHPAPHEAPGGPAPGSDVVARTSASEAERPTVTPWPPAPLLADVAEVPTVPLAPWRPIEPFLADASPDPGSPGAWSTMPVAGSLAGGRSDPPSSRAAGVPVQRTGGAGPGQAPAEPGRPGSQLPGIPQLPAAPWVPAAIGMQRLPDRATLDRDTPDRAAPDGAALDRGAPDSPARAGAAGSAGAFPGPVAQRVGVVAPSPRLEAPAAELPGGAGASVDEPSDATSVEGRGTPAWPPALVGETLAGFSLPAEPRIPVSGTPVVARSVQWGGQGASGVSGPPGRGPGGPAGREPSGAEGPPVQRTAARTGIAGAAGVPTAHRLPAGQPGSSPPTATIAAGTVVTRSADRPGAGSVTGTAGDVALRLGLGSGSPDGSVVFAEVGHDSAEEPVVSRQEVGPPAAPEPAGPVVQAVTVPAGPAAPAAPAGPSGGPGGEDIETLAMRLYPRISRQLRLELTHERDRLGALTDFRH